MLMLVTFFGGREGRVWAAITAGRLAGLIEREVKGLEAETEHQAAQFAAIIRNLDLRNIFQLMVAIDTSYIKGKQIYRLVERATFL